jgi:hypothetical protein
MINPANAKLLLCLTRRPATNISTDGCHNLSLDWLRRARGPRPMCSPRTNIVAVDPRNPSTVYAASQEWSCSKRRLGRNDEPHRLAQCSRRTAVAVDPSDSRIIYVGTNVKPLQNPGRWRGRGASSRLSGAGGLSDNDRKSIQPIRRWFSLALSTERGEWREAFFAARTAERRSFVSIRASVPETRSVAVLMFWSVRFDVSGVVGGRRPSTGVCLFRPDIRRSMARCDWQLRVSPLLH